MLISAQSTFNFHFTLLVSFRTNSKNKRKIKLGEDTSINTTNDKKNCEDNHPRITSILKGEIVGFLMNFKGATEMNNNDLRHVEEIKFGF